MTEFKDAKEMLAQGKTCVVFSADKVIVSSERGIKPLMKLIAEKVDVNGFCLADKIIGKAAAFLAVKLKIKEVYGEVMSKAGAETLEKFNIKCSYKILTDKIINREGTGICPMENAVKDIEDAQKGYIALKNKLESLIKK